MNAPGLQAGARRPLANRTWQMVREELAPYPGRGGATLRYVLGSAVIIIDSLALQVPFLTLALVAFFFAMQENYTLSRKLTIMGLVAATGTIALSILLIKFTIDHPMLRILGAGLIAFAGVYLLRISKQLAPAGFLMAFGVVYAQSLVDIIQNGEALTRYMLWVQVCGLHVACVVLLLAFMFPSTRPAHQLKVELGQALDEVIQSLEAGRAGRHSPLSLDAIERAVTRHQRVLGFAAMDAPHGARDWGRQLARITAVERLHLAATRLFPMAAGAPDAARMEQQERLIRACEGLKQDLAQDRPFRLHQDLAGPLAKVHGEDAALREMADALESLAEAEAAPAAVEPPPREPLFRPDAFSDPAHLKFALRTVLAATACYVFYTAVDWPGIHTAMLTCIILAIPPLGMSSLGGISHKSLVRLLGALLGSGIALFATVFILPRLDGITGLLAMILPVIALAGWITAGSSKSNYVGRQMMFTYVMALLGRFTLTPDIPEIRDRIVGILLGVAVYLALAAFVWPDREGASLRDLLARMVRSLGDLVRAGAEPAAKAPGMHPFDRARAESWKLLRQSRDLQVRVALEPGLTDAPGLSDLDLHAGFARAQETLCAADWLRVQVGQLAPEVRAGLEGELAKFRGCAGRQLEQIAGRLEGSPGAAPLLPSEAALEPAATAKAGEVAATVHALREHITQLGAHLLAGAPQPVERS